MVRKIPEQGFTLLELLLSVGISMLLLGGIVAGYNSFNDTQVLIQAALTLKNTMQVAQVKATSVAKPATGCTQFLGYRITFAATSYTVSALCSEGTVDPLTVTLPLGVSFSPLPPAITFEALTKRLTSGAQTDVTLAGRSKSYVLIIEGNGNISDEGLQ